jgi:hypothetical protein
MLHVEEQKWRGRERAWYGTKCCGLWVLKGKMGYWDFYRGLLEIN